MEYRREDDDDYELSFSNEPIDCCVSIVDMGGQQELVPSVDTIANIERRMRRTMSERRSFDSLPGA